MRLIERNLDFRYELIEAEGRPLRVGGECQLADVKNANGRVYPLPLWQRGMESGKIKSRLGERKMLGELDHPESGKTALSRVSHLMTKLELVPSKFHEGKTAVYGEYEVLPT